jgi:transcription antitermination factor NusG
MNRKWYAVYTKPQSERKVAASLEKKRIESFCPHNRMLYGQGSRRKMVYEPLFPTFVFVNITDAEMYEVRRTGDVINFVYWLGRPAEIKKAEIESIANFNGLYCNIKVERTPVNALGIIHITNEPTGMALSTARVKLTLPSLGFALWAETDKALVEQTKYETQNTEALV